MCDRCHELLERVAWLESELGIQTDATNINILRKYMFERARGPTRHMGAASLVMALYRANGRVMSKDQLLDAVPPRYNTGPDERGTKIIDVWVCFARKAFGPGAIETMWGGGYRLTENGRQTVENILNPPLIDPIAKSRASA